jgi:hypothetical protein
MPGRYRDSVDIDSAKYAGTYKNLSEAQSNQYVYYFNGKRDDDHIHFSAVDTDGGSSSLTNFHITVPFNMGASVANFHIYYRWNPIGNSGYVTYSGNNLGNLQSAARAIAESYFDTNRKALFLAASDFAEKVRTGAAVLQVASAGGSVGARTPVGSLASVSAAPVSGSPLGPGAAAHNGHVQLNLAATPILSQANAVGQGFDIYGVFGIDSLIHPLFDYSKAGTQVFTFLGKDYLVPSIITPVESTSSYYTGDTYESREDFQNSFALHAGVEASYGAFSGEMKADFASEYTESAEYAYAYTNFYSQLAYLELNHTEYLTNDFQQRVNDLPTIANEDTLPAFELFFNDFGIYYTSKIVIGGVLEFFVSLSKSSNMSKAQFSAAFNAQYKGVFTNGSIDASVTGSQEWKTYRQNSRVSIRANGGTPEAVAALTGIDPFAPSQDTVNKFQTWVHSVSTDPAIVDFSLRGIWELCGDKREAVRSAWQLFAQKMHPRVVIETSSEVRDISWSGTPQPPIITIGNLVRPSQPPQSPCGFQVVILDGTDITNPDAVLFNQYFTVPTGTPWYAIYGNMYQDIYNSIVSSGHTSKGNVLIISSFGIDNNMPPTNQIYSLLQTVGAGERLRYWESHNDAGSMVGNPTAWVSYPANYILVGIFGAGPDTGVEAYNVAGYSDSSITERLTVIFYRQSIDGQYTLGTGS